MHGAYTSSHGAVFSVKLAELFLNSDPVELYEYIAVRDGLDPWRNYIVNVM
jgi:hypothetical protein